MKYAATPQSRPTITGQPKLRFRLSPEVLRHARSGPTPVRNRIARPTGIMILLKKGAPTLIREPESPSETTGKRVPERTAIQATRKSRLLKRKLDSREIMESSWFSLFR